MNSTRLAWILLLVSPFVYAQNDTKLKTTGACSPAVTGANNKITISCSGVSSGKADQMITLMNRILAERLDMSEVNSKLDQLSTAVDTLNSSLDPFANATPAQLATLKENARIVASCDAFASDWSTEQIDSMQNSIRHKQAAPSRNASEDDQQRSEFKRTIGLQLNALNKQLHSLMNDSSSVTDLSSPLNSTEAGQFGTRVLLLARQYQQQENQAGRQANPSLFSQAQKLQSQAVEFARNWNHANMASLMAARSQGPPAANPTLAASDQLTAERLAKYHDTLEPEFVAFRARLAPHTPDYKSTKDYSNLKSEMQFLDVCRDLNKLSIAYSEKMGEDLKAMRSAPKSKSLKPTK